MQTLSPLIIHRLLILLILLRLCIFSYQFDVCKSVHCGWAVGSVSVVFNHTLLLDEYISSEIFYKVMRL